MSRGAANRIAPGLVLLYVLLDHSLFKGANRKAAWHVTSEALRAAFAGLEPCLTRRFAGARPAPTLAVLLPLE